MLSKEKQKAIIEGMLFVSTQPLPLNKIVKRLRAIDQKQNAPEQLEAASDVESQDQQIEQNNLDSQSSAPEDVTFLLSAMASNDNMVNEIQVEDESGMAPEADEEFVFQNLSADDEVIENADDAVEVESDESDESDDIMAQLIQKSEELEQEISAADVRDILAEMQNDFLSDERGVELVFVARGYQLRTKYDIAEALQDDKVQAPSRFSPSSLETLSIVAYQQPVTKQKVDQIRV